MLVELNQIIVQPGQQILFKNVSWEMFEKILEELGETRSSRLSYSQGMLEIMSPLLEHESGKEMIGDLVKALLEELEIDFYPAGSTTLRNKDTIEGVEPDSCFYIQNQAAVKGKKRIDLEIDPPPDLAIEIDITSRTKFNNYQVLGVPELWRYNGRKLQINVLQEGKYVESLQSRQFPDIAIAEVIPQYLDRCRVENRNAVMKAFRAWVREQI